ncbi:MAG: hypothetical protein ACHQQQ_11270 [Bacteroidota bacterium]
MLKSIIVILAVLFTAPVVNAQLSIKKKLSRDYVRIESGKMVFEKNGILHDPKDTNITKPTRIRFRCEAPAKGLLSRDFFMISSALAVIQFFPKGQIFDEQPAMTDSSDIEFKIIMETAGIRVMKRYRNAKKYNESITPWEMVLDNF